MRNEKYGIYFISKYNFQFSKKKKKKKENYFSKYVHVSIYYGILDVAMFM